MHNALIANVQRQSVTKFVHSQLTNVPFLLTTYLSNLDSEEEQCANSEMLNFCAEFP